MRLDYEALKSARRQLLDDGFCIVDGMLPDGELEHLQSWSDDWLHKTQHPSHWKYQGSDLKINGLHSAVRRYAEKFPKDETVDMLVEHPREILDAMQLEDITSFGHFQIISKPPGAPALYWHQDWAQWDDPISMSPWPQQIFLNWYLTETKRENGCLRVIPGSHRRRFEIHSHLIPPHEGGGYDVAETNEWMFLDYPDAVDVPVTPGDLVIADGRLLHGTHINNSAERRTVLLGWYARRSLEIPERWEGEVPQEILDRDPDLPVNFNRQPGIYLR